MSSSLKSPKTPNTAEKLLRMTLTAARNTSGIRKCSHKRPKMSPKAVARSRALLNAPKDAQPAFVAIENMHETPTPAPRPPKAVPELPKEGISTRLAPQPRKRVIFTNSKKSEPKPAPVVPETLLPVPTEPVLVAQKDQSVTFHSVANDNVEENVPVGQPEQQPATEPSQTNRHEKRPPKHEGLAQSMYSSQGKYGAQNVPREISQEHPAVQETVDLDMGADAAAADLFDDMDTAEGAIPANLDIHVEPSINPD
jgi:hypothetical protein